MDSSSDLYSSIPLDANNREIRVLRLLPGSQNESMKLELYHVSLNDLPPYCVLSYCWGSQTNVQVVQVENRPFQISSHLHACLVNLRAKEEPLSIWIDAICINQGSNLEKNTQVPLMGHIYKGASEVFIWLGESNPGLDLIFTAISRVAARKINIKPERIEQIAEELLGASPEATDAAFSEFVGFQWFHRTWIMQELALPRSAPILVCGRHRAVWADLKCFLDIAQSINNEVYHYSQISLPAWRNLSHNLHDFFRVVTRLSSLRRYFEMPVVFDTGFPLSWLVVASEESQATDPRDKIYGLLGMANTKVRSSVTIDYDKSVEDLFEEASRHIIFSEDRLSLITTLMADLERLPDESNLKDTNLKDHTLFEVRKQTHVKSSWIRELAYVRDPKRRHTPLVKPFEARGLIYNASNGSRATAFGHQSKGVLSIMGMYIDTVKECITAWSVGSEEREWNLNLGGILDVFFRAGRKPATEELAIRPTAAEGSKKQVDARPVSKGKELGGKAAAGQKEEDVSGRPGEYPWHLLYQPLQGPVEPIREAIWRTLIGDKVDTETSERAPEFYELLFEFLLSMKQGVSPVKLEMKTDVFGSGDEFEKHWNIFQSRYQSVVYRRSAFSTENGWIGLGPDWMRRGDIAVILSGGDLPTILRPIEGGFIIVGECYIEGAMYGDFITASFTPDEKETPAEKRQAFRIY